MANGLLLLDCAECLNINATILIKIHVILFDKFNFPNKIRTKNPLFAD